MLLRMGNTTLKEGNAPLLPYIIRVLKTLGFHQEAKEMALNTS